MRSVAKRDKIRSNKGVNRALRAFAWLGVALLYYVLFSWLFDTPAEYALRHSTDKLKEEYEVLLKRYDSLSVVADNVIERERDIFAMLFESEPYDFESEYNRERIALYESLLRQSSGDMERSMEQSLDALEQKLQRLEESYNELDASLSQIGSSRNNIPSIQPVINHELTLLTAPYGVLMHPFYRTMQPHQGVDYTLPEGSRIFATADGIVKEVRGKNSTSGVTVVIDHRNGYVTSYSHLQSAKVKRGRKVHRGDIIALSGNTGLSLAPHLHYEVRYNGVRVDPIHYFFMELTPDEYQRIMRIAQSGMQSFD
ncbi:MAG: peptidoglycan DD-metalloendopeptidase family protein [Alistipes sp.]|nr:peptidoglycan DD-metalloendopeptidase family protein [Alistipes sp.]